MAELCVTCFGIDQDTNELNFCPGSQCELDWNYDFETILKGCREELTELQQIQIVRFINNCRREAWDKRRNQIHE